MVPGVDILTEGDGRFMSEDKLIRALARLMYLVYCERAGKRPHRDGYVPGWALDYAECALDVLGYDDDAPARVGEAVDRVMRAVVPA